jgi:hypothetical protein
LAGPRKFEIPLSAERGVITDAPFARQPKGSVRDARNMRPVDPRTGVRRLSVRSGTRGLGVGTVPASGTDAGGRIQAMTHVLRPQTPTLSDVKGRIVRPVIVAGGIVKRVLINQWPANVTYGTASGPTLDSSLPIIAAMPFRQYVYFADGNNLFRWNPDSNTVVSFANLTGEDNYAGEHPTGCRLGCVWRNRLVVAGDPDAPHNWFMSAVDNPLDWDYGPNPERETQAVAGTSSPAGHVADIINTLAPLSGDALLIGCDHSLLMMRGDPAAGGRIDLISDTEGMGWGQPWCKSPDGTVYFWGSRGGLYRMRGTALERISHGKIESLLRDYDLSTTLCRPVWNDREVGVNFYFTDTTGNGGNVHIFYDVLSESFWIDEFADNRCDVSCPHVLDGDESGDRTVLLGGLDGIIRYYDAESDWDENAGKEWYVDLGPLTLGEMRHAMLDEVEVTFQTLSNTGYEIRTGETAEKAFEAAFKIRDEFPDGTGSDERQRIRERLSGNAIYFRIGLNNGSTNGNCSIEQVRAVLRESGRTSQRMRR